MLSPSDLSSQSRLHPAPLLCQVGEEVPVAERHPLLRPQGAPARRQDPGGRGDPGAEGGGEMRWERGGPTVVPLYATSTGAKGGGGLGGGLGSDGEGGGGGGGEGEGGGGEAGHCSSAVRRSSAWPYTQQHGHHHEQCEHHEQQSPAAPACTCMEARSPRPVYRGRQGAGAAGLAPAGLAPAAWCPAAMLPGARARGGGGDRAHRRAALRARCEGHPQHPGSIRPRECVSACSLLASRSLPPRFRCGRDSSCRLIKDKIIWSYLLISLTVTFAGYVRFGRVGFIRPHIVSAPAP